MCKLGLADFSSPSARFGESSKAHDLHVLEGCSRGFADSSTPRVVKCLVAVQLGVIKPTGGIELAVAVSSDC